jgi:hypothetical protein
MHRVASSRCIAWRAADASRGEQQIHRVASSTNPWLADGQQDAQPPRGNLEGGWSGLEHRLESRRRGWRRRGGGHRCRRGRGSRPEWGEQRGVGLQQLEDHQLEQEGHREQQEDDAHSTGKQAPRRLYMTQPAHDRTPLCCGMRKSLALTDRARPNVLCDRSILPLRQAPELKINQQVGSLFVRETRRRWALRWATYHSPTPLQSSAGMLSHPFALAYRLPGVPSSPPCARLRPTPLVRARQGAQLRQKYRAVAAWRCISV